MRPVTYLSIVLLVILGFLAFAQTLYPARTAAQDPGLLLNPQASIPPLASDGVQMYRRADIRVMPVDLLAADKAELESIREQIVRTELDGLKLDISDPAVREHVSRQLALLRALLRFADHQYSDERKSPSALAVQKHLNQIEGQRNCEACHVAKLASLR
jgi:hypothetical protein